MILYFFDVLKVYIDENCFNWLIFFLLFGCEKYYGKMWVRILFELVYNEKWYLNVEVLGKMLESVFLMLYFYELLFLNESRVIDNVLKFF